MTNFQTVYESTNTEEDEIIAKNGKNLKMRESRPLSWMDALKVLTMLTIILTGLAWMSQKPEPLIQKGPTTWATTISHALSSLKAPKKYQGIQKVMPFAEIPFCLIVMAEDSFEQEAIDRSLKAQTYSNYKAVTAFPDFFNYYQLHDLTLKQCPEKSVLMFVSQPLQPDALKATNLKYQSYNTWMTYTPLENGKGSEIFTLYLRIFQLIGKNSFDELNTQYLKTRSPNAMISAVLELCRNFNFPMEIQDIYDMDFKSAEPSILRSVNDEESVLRETYQPMMRFNQDFKYTARQLQSLEEKAEKFEQEIENLDQKITKASMERAYEYTSLPFLPAEHALNARERTDIENKYKLSQYGDKEVPFCVTVLSRDNVENDRYKKVMDTILQQQYSNYHIVFMDDSSTDNTLGETKKYLEQKGFPKERVTFVESLTQNRATYNIINAAFQFCGENQIQLLVDGDDELIGKTVFKVLNSAFQSGETWIAYSTYISTEFGRPRASPITNENQMLTSHNKRRMAHFIGPVRCWQVKLVRSLPLDVHQYLNGEWFDTMYDDAIQPALFERSGVDKVKPISEIHYLYTTNYSGGDGSTVFKRLYRFFMRAYLMMRAPMQRLESLEDAQPQYQILNLLEADKDITYTVVQ